MKTTESRTFRTNGRDYIIRMKDYVYLLLRDGENDRFLRAKIMRSTCKNTVIFSLMRKLMSTMMGKKDDDEKR